MNSTLVPVQRTHAVPAQDADSIVRTWLDKFRSMTPHGIYLTLKKAGVLGSPCNPGDCGLAVFFRHQTNTYIRVASAAVLVFGKVQTRYPLPLSCQAFIRWFDSGLYTDLYRPGAPIPRVVPQAGYVVTAMHVSENGTTETWATEYIPLQVSAPPVTLPELVGV